MFVADQRATIDVRALYGPPRAVLVVSITGEIDCANDVWLFDLVSRAITVAADRSRAKSYFGSRYMAPALVVDLRGAAFVAIKTLHGLVDHVEQHGHALRFVASRTGIVNRALRLLDAKCSPAVHANLADAVLADVAVAG